ncbi:hypothetical protein [Streptomyces sp. NBC_01197]|uniref:hypothetical protein n=1 Tax=Streptomyces sp. NBC_01197 TaxID=2903768 RepID=UPI002E0F6533|nr:hypothetical protein OG452_35105 [Streptomyces sp. NBC_01197]
MGWCDFWDDNLSALGRPPACEAKDGATGAVKDAASSAWESIVHSFQEGAVWMVRELALGWLSADTPTLNKDSGPLAFLLSSTFAITTWLAVLCLLVAAGKMAWTRRTEPAQEAAKGMVRLVVATSTAVAAVNLLTKGGDLFSNWIVNRSIGCPGDSATHACIEAFSNKLLEMSTLKNVDQLSVSLIIAILMSLSGLIQLFSVIVRQSLLFVLVGTLPMAAAASGSEQGQAWWKKSVGWLLAFICYKPAAAIIYATAFSQFQTNDSKDLMPQLYGVALLIMSAFTLPALMKFIAPVIDNVGGGGLAGIGGGGGGGGMASRVATGAIAIKSGGASLAAKGAAKGASSASGAKPAGGGPTSPPGGGSGGGKPPGGTPPNGGAPSQPSAGPNGGTPPGQSGGTAPTSGTSGPANRPSGGVPPARSSGAGSTPNGPGPGGSQPARPAQQPTRPSQQNKNGGGPSGSSR